MIFFSYRAETFKFVFNDDIINLDPDTKNGIKSFPVTDTIQYYFKDPAISGDDRWLSLSYLLVNYATITDLLWYYSDTSYAQTLRNKLDTLAAFTDTVLQVTEPWGEPPPGGPYRDYPSAVFDNERILLSAALGYAGCVLDSIHYYQYADSQLFEYRHPDFPFNGYLTLKSGSSGAFKEGPGYMAFAMHGLTPYFTARKRLTEKN